MTTQTQFHARPYAGEADLAPLCDLINTCAAIDQPEDSIDEESLRLWINTPDRDLAHDVRVWEDAAGRPVAFGLVWAPTPKPEEDTATSRLAQWVHPAVRRQGVETEIFAWAEARARTVAAGKPGELYCGVHQGDTYGEGIRTEHGFTVVRYFFKMARPLDQPIPEPQFPAGYTLRHVASDEDVERWVDLLNWSFIDHWNYRPTTVEQHKHWLAVSHYRPEHDLIAVAADGTFAALCFCSINTAENARSGRNEGWIDTLGTRRGHRGIGLGRAIMLAGLQLLKREGVATALLDVDAENPTGALRLYESVGFQTVSTGVAYRKDL
jgi:mycothiol synthase